MGISNLINDRGNAAANQFVINTKNATYFQSYASVVAKLQRGKKPVLSSHWDYSNTTTKHLYIFLRDNGYYVSGRNDVLRMIKDKEIIVKKECSLALV